MNRFLRLLLCTLWCAVVFPLGVDGQTTPETLEQYRSELKRIEATQDSIRGLIETVRLEELRAEMHALGFPEDDFIEHSAMVLAYDERHEQAKWVMHIIAPEIIQGTVGRTNDFRPDPKVVTGSAVEEDYFLKTLQTNGEYSYDGFGFDRGHLAPSADFRWSFNALSESYFYSNMSPQRAEFNRGGWADLEDALRAYIYRNPEHHLVVVTLPVLHDELPVVERSINRVTIPETYVKVAFDPKAERGIAFAMPNSTIDRPLASYAMTIREAEEMTGFDFFPLLDTCITNVAETTYNIEDWLTESLLGDVEPLFAPDLPRGHFNTTQAARHMGSGKEVVVCGTVVGSRTARSGNVWLNLDRQYPNQVFSVYIKKEHLINFSYDPEKSLNGEVICVKARISDLSGTPTMRIEREKQLVVGEP